MEPLTPIIRNCSRGCEMSRNKDQKPVLTMRYSYCKLASFNWLEGMHKESLKKYFEVRFKNTHKGYYINDSPHELHEGDFVAVEAASGHDIGIISMEGPLLGLQMNRRGINPQTYPFKKIYRKAKLLDLEKWQEAIAREHQVMIRARQIAAEQGLDMKIGDVEFQGDGTKAIFYYIADERVDFRKLIKVFASEFKIRIEMRQFGARQEAGLIGGIGVCGQELCCSRWMAEFKSITTQAARAQDLSLNPQKLAGQCCKLKCCINYEAPVYMDAYKAIPKVNGPLDTEDGPCWLIKTHILGGKLYFSYDPHSQSNLIELPAAQVREYLEMNKRGEKIPSLQAKREDKAPDFQSAEDSITRFDNTGRNKGRGRNGRNRNNKKNGQGNGKETLNKENAGRENASRENVGKENVGKENVGKENVGKESPGRENGGRDHARGGQGRNRNHPRNKQAAKPANKPETNHGKE